MRFFDARDDGRLGQLVAHGAIQREALESAVGERSVSLLEVLLEYHALFPVGAWLASGVRQGLARIAGSPTTLGFLREGNFSEAQRERLLGDCFLPFARNAFDQTLVATVPGWTVSASTRQLAAPATIDCILTLGELRALRAQYTLLGEMA